MVQPGTNYPTYFEGAGCHGDIRLAPLDSASPFSVLQRKIFSRWIKNFFNNKNKRKFSLVFLDPPNYFGDARHSRNICFQPYANLLHLGWRRV